MDERCVLTSFCALYSAKALSRTTGSQKRKFSPRIATPRHLLIAPRPPSYLAVREVTDAARALAISTDAWHRMG